MPKLDFLCHQVKPCARNGLYLDELLIKGFPCNSQTTQAVAKAIDCDSQLNGRVLLLKTMYVIHFYLICLSVCLKTCLTHVMQYPQWPENGIGSLGPGVSECSEPPLGMLGVKHTSSGRKASRVTVEPAPLTDKL